MGLELTVKESQHIGGNLDASADFQELGGR